MIIVNGKSILDNKIELDSGFFFGKGLFETILVKNKPVFLKEHLKRLNDGLLKIGIDIKISEKYFIENMKKLNCKNCSVKIAVSEKNIIFTKREIGYKDNDYVNGFNVKISDLKRNCNSHMVYLKSFNYLENILEREEALKEGYNEVLFLNNYGYLSEGSISNVFWIKNKKIYTPSLECGILPGTLRKWIINNMEVHIGKFKLEELINSDGAFLTNSLMGIMMINSINKNTLKKSDIIENVRLKYEEYINNKF